jgi:hypothetical protein
MREEVFVSFVLFVSFGSSGLWPLAPVLLPSTTYA